jgi:invasion protein IalB
MGARAGLTALMLSASIGFLAAPAMAQQPAKPGTPAAPAAGQKPAAPAAAGQKPAAGAPAAAGQKPAGDQSAWVKLCEKAPSLAEPKKELNVCLTHHERLDGNTGMVLVSAAIRQVEGQDKEALMVMVPLGMALPPGLRAAIYTKDQWAKAANNEKIDEGSLKPIDLKYSLCHPAGCTAETEASAEIINQMKGGGGIMILAMNAAAEPVGFPVPLDGYAEAAAGAPIDNKKYAEARGQLMRQIRDRQMKMAEKYKAEQMKNLPPPPTTGAAPAARPAPRPAPAP